LNASHCLAKKGRGGVVCERDKKIRETLDTLDTLDTEIVKSQELAIYRKRLVLLLYNFGHHGLNAFFFQAELSVLCRCPVTYQQD